jgi:predicted PurR-regulated permease PerM
VTRREALYGLLLAVALLTAGLTWLLGPYGLIIGGVAIGAAVLLLDEKPEERREAVADAPAWPPRA